MVQNNPDPSDEAPRRRGRPRAFDTQAALDAAVRVFWAKGYDGASVDDLTEAMQIARPSLYAAWGDKSALFLAALDHYGQGIAARPLQAFEGQEEITRAVEAFLSTALDGNMMPDCPPGCLFATSAAAVTETVPGVVDRLVGAREKTRERIMQRFRAEIAQNRLPHDFPVAERSSLLLDLMLAQANRARNREPREVLVAEIPSRVALMLAA